MAYFSTTSLSTEDERVPCTTTLTFADLGFLDPSSSADDEDLPLNSTIEAPLWFARFLKQKEFARIKFPRHFREAFLETLDAGPAAINLREQSPHYFAVGDALSRTENDDELQKKLLFAFTGDRFLRIMDLAFNSQNEDISEKSHAFTDLELSLFDAAFQSTVAFSNWKSRKQSSLRVSSAVADPEAKRHRAV
jgi:hypothetical protein